MLLDRSDWMHKKITTYILLLCLVFIGPGCRNKYYTTTVRYETEGCFGSEERVIKIDHYKDKAIAHLEINGKKVRQAHITKGQILALYIFERELKEWTAKKNPYSSTVNETISIQRGHVREGMQYSGHWDGFERLTVAFGLEN